MVWDSQGRNFLLFSTKLDQKLFKKSITYSTIWGVYLIFINSRVMDEH